MFLESVWEGITFLGNWQVLLAGLVYIGLVFVFHLSVGLLVVKTESGGLGRLFQLLGGTILQGVLMGILVAFILPLMLGAANAAPVAALSQHFWPLIKTGVIAIVAVTLLCIVPVAGRFIASSPGVQGFLEGVIIFRLLSGEFIDMLLTRVNSGIQVYPDLLQSIGFLIMSGALARAIMFVLALAALHPKADPEHSPIFTIGGMALGSIGGVLPLFVYTSYVRLMLEQAARTASGR